MSFLKRLFGGANDDAPAAPARQVEHNGFVIRATPYKEGTEYQTCGVELEEIDGELKEHRFVRAERFPTLEGAAEHSITKGRQIVDQQGDRVFTSS